MEIEFGLNINPQKANKIRPITDEFFKQISIISFGKKEALYTSRIRGSLKKLGTPIGAYDVLIGASALANSLILVTANYDEFQRIQDLEIENWRTNS